MKLYKHQEELVVKCNEIINKYGIVYLAAEPRVGKTLTALTVGLNYNKVLFVTKKKAMPDIESAYKDIGYDYNITIINYESLHKINDKDYDLVICDEAHTLGAYPKPSKRSKQLKDLVTGHLMLMSGTPHPESWSQIYHQFYITKKSPFRDYMNFYKWANIGYVNIQQKRVGIYPKNDYSDGVKSMIEKMVKPYFISFTQKQAGFSSSVNEDIIEVEMKDSTYKIAKQLKEDKLVQGKSGTILADTAAKMMQKLHQIYSGTCKLEDDISVILDTTKADVIKEKFKNNKIGIFYKFTKEKEMLQEVFGDTICFDVDEFNSTDKNIALQIVSGREGISLRQADYLVFLNIDFSATSYFQALARTQTMDRLNTKVFWVFAKKGIEYKIYKAVKNKKNFTLDVYKEYEK